MSIAQSLAGSGGSLGSRNPNASASSYYTNSNGQDGGSHSFGFGQTSSYSRPSRKPLDLQQSYQYLGSALIDQMCTEQERTPDEVKQLAEALTKVEQDQQKQEKKQQQQKANQITSQIIQNLLGSLVGGNGGPFDGGGGGDGGGGSPATGGDGEGKNSFSNDAYRDSTLSESLQELEANPEQIDKLTDKELLKLLEEQDPEDICDISPELNKKLMERLKEIEEKKEKEQSEESKKIQELKDTNGTPPLKEQYDAWERANEKPPTTFTPEGQQMVDAINDAIKTDGMATHYGNDATVSVGNLANDIMKSQMSTADKATALGSLQNMVYQQQSDALSLISLNPAKASQYWGDFYHNMGLTSQALSERLAIPSNKWLQSSTTPASSVNEFLSYAGYPGATNINQGNYGSCWLCPTNSSIYRKTPGELAMMQNQGITTGKITSPWTNQTANVSNWLTSSDNALYNPNIAAQNLRSPLITMDQEVMAQFAGYHRAGGGGDPYAGIKGAYAYTGLTDAVVGSGVGAGFLTSESFQQMAWAPGHYWSKDKINGTVLNSSGNYAAHQTLIGNNSWGSEPFEVAHAATAQGLAAIRMPGGSGGIGGGGGLGGLGGLFNGFRPLGGNINYVNDEQTPNPLDDPAVRACLADICADIAKQGLEKPQSCAEMESSNEFGSEEAQSSSTMQTTASSEENKATGSDNASSSTKEDATKEDDRLSRLLRRVQKPTNTAAAPSHRATRSEQVRKTKPIHQPYYYPQKRAQSPAAFDTF